MKRQISNVTAVISAAGRGTRMGCKTNKLLLPLGGLPILERTLLAVSACPYIKDYVIVVRPENEQAVQEMVGRVFGDRAPNVRLVYGGETREKSTWNGLQALPEETKIVLTHDGDRPFTNRAMIERALNKLIDLGSQVSGVICAVPVTDTIKIVNKSQIVQATPPRKNLFAVQTPQVFWKDDLVNAYRRGRHEMLKVTDDAGIVEIIGGRIAIVEGDYGNIKITTREDLSTGETIIKKKKAEGGKA